MNADFLNWPDLQTKIGAGLQAGGVDGMQSLDQDLQRLVTKGSIERKIAQSIADNPKLFAQNVL